MTVSERREELATRAIKAWGRTIQVRHIAEESTELSLAAQHLGNRADPLDWTAFIAKYADMEIMMEQAKQIILDAGKDARQRLHMARDSSMAKLERHLIEADS